jgi:uncharacterized pyridoxamine 5'-phosphate oxidase family protein
MATAVYREMSEKLMNLLNTRFLAAMLATVDEDGFPRIIPISLFSTIDSKTILTAMQANCRSAHNIHRNGKVMLTVCAESDIAVGIKGKATMVSEMTVFRGGAIFQIDVLEIKDDSAIDVEVVSGVVMKLRSPKWEKIINAAAAELDTAAGVEKRERVL